jgi:AAA15 family ATPase/GTPase
MLIEFKVANYRSIGEEQVLSFVPAAKQREYLENVITEAKYESLNVLGLYGNNASGKTNLLLSMSLLDRLIHLSARSSSTTPLPYEPFMLRDDWHDKPTRFEITFIHKDNRYRYGVEFLADRVLREWLYRKSQSREVALFTREGEIIDTGAGFRGNQKLIDAAIEATRENALYLSTCDMLNVEEAKDIFQWFRYFHMINGLNTEDQAMNTIALLNNNNCAALINLYFHRLNLGIEKIDVMAKDFDPSELPGNLPEGARNLISEELKGKKGFTILTSHKTYDKEGNPTGKYLTWRMEENESAGTSKAFQISGPVVWALMNGGVLIIDEIESKMHPKMTLDTIELFLDKEMNPHNAQLIFATHDTNVLTYSRLRRDQIYFAQKNKWESTEIYSLSDFVYMGSNDPIKLEKERPDTDKEKRYLEGRYGAVPKLGSVTDLKPIINKWPKEEN